MALLTVVTWIVVVVGLLLVVASVGILGPARLRSTYHHLRPRLRAVAGPALILLLTLALNGVLRSVGADLSWLVGLNVSGIIYDIEGNLVPFVQSFATPPLTAYFSFVYVFGYALLLTFPLIAYLALSDSRPLRTLLIAYVVNYVLGLVGYVIFIAYGPRNLIPGLVESLLYNTYPQLQLLTSEVNVNTNVFPSLHASLSTTVALLAARSRGVYFSWFVVATLGAVSVCISTLYLGIHWALDVVGGIALAVVAVHVGSMDRWHRDE